MPNHHHFGINPAQLRSRLGTLAVILVLLTGVLLMRLQSYLLFHVVAEMTSITIGTTVLIIAWNSARLQENGYLLLLGVGSGFVAVVDLLHTVAFKGMGVFPGNDTNLPTQLWLAERYLYALTFLSATFFLRRRINRDLVMVVFATLTAVLLASIFIWKVFPTAYIEGTGLTPFKIASEYAIIAVLMVVIALLWRNREAIDRYVFIRLVGALSASIIAEFAFTLYFGITDIAALIGHLFEIVAYYLLYHALVEVAFTRPYDLVFKQLKQSETKARMARTEVEKALQESEHKYRSLVDNALTGVYQASMDGTILFVNPEMARIFNYDSPDDLIGRQFFELVKDPQETARQMKTLEQNKQIRNFEAELLTRDGQTRFVLTSARLEGGTLSGMVRDITGIKQSEQALRESEDRYRNALESMMEGCQIIGFDWRYLFLNQSAVIQARQNKEELLGRTMMECYPGIEDTELFHFLQQCMDERISLRKETEFIYPDGSRGWFELGIEPVQDGIFILTQDISERKQAEQRIQTQFQRLDALHIIDSAITGVLNLKLVLNIVLEQATSQLGMDAACVHLLNPHSATLAYAAGRGFRRDTIESSSFRLGEGHGGRAALERRVEIIPDLPANLSDFERADLLAGEDFLTYCAAPMVAKGHVVGVLELFHRSPHVYDDEWLNFLETLAKQAAIAADNAHLFENLQRSNINLELAYDATIEGWSHALDLRDKETEGHTQRVTEMTQRLARAEGLKDNEIINIRRGALLHDIGKMGIPDTILLKADKLSDDEWIIMRQHPQFAYDLLSPITYLKPALDIPYCHHEKWDGSGYPRGLKGAQIPLAARLFAIVDVWDALRSDRPYRKSWPKEKVLEHIKTGSGTHFDPRVVELFFRLIAEDI